MILTRTLLKEKFLRIKKTGPQSSSYRNLFQRISVTPTPVLVVLFLFMSVIANALTLTVPTPSAVHCPGDASSSITAVASGGYPLYQFKLLKNGLLFVDYQDSNVFESLTAGSYTVFVRDSHGATKSTTVSIGVENASSPNFDTEPVDAIVLSDAVPEPETIRAYDQLGHEVPVTFEEIREEGNCPNSYILYRTWSASDDCGNTSTFPQTITVVPAFNMTDKDYCVKSINAATYDEPTRDITSGDRQEWYMFSAGSTGLDITNYSDNCLPSSNLTLNWRIDFADETSLTGEGQVSSHGSDIQFAGAADTDVTHHITYWISDEIDNQTDEKQYAIIIHSRPKIN